MLSQQELTATLQQHEIGLSAPEMLIELREGPIFSVTIEGRSYALSQWQQARDLVAVTGFWPVVVDPTDVTVESLLFRQLQAGEETAELVRQAKAMDPMQMLAKRLHAPIEVFSKEEARSHLPDWLKNSIGIWPDFVNPKDFDPHDFFIPEELMDIPKKKKMVSLCFLPLQQSWEVPALLRYGGWNDCPLPVEHAAIHQLWQDRYGAEIVCLRGDTMECHVPHPPTTQQECRKLALEHAAYCPDRVQQDMGSLEKLAGHLLRNRIWYFWWD